MRSISVSLLLLALIAACGGGAPGATGTPAPTSGATGTPAASGSAAATATAASTPGQPAGGGTTVTVTLSGGPDAGTYTGTDDPHCSRGIVGPGGWGTQFSIVNAEDQQLSSLQLVIPAPGAEDDEDSMFSGTSFLMTVVVGTLFEPSSRTYEVKVVTESSDDEPSGTGQGQVTDNGATAVIHATGTTAAGVGIDATVNCPTVTRL